MPEEAAEEEQAEGEEAPDPEQSGKFAPNMNDESDNILINMTKLVTSGGMDDVFILEKFNRTEIQKILFVQSCIPKIKEFI